jgi:hypothetical protein
MSHRTFAVVALLGFVTAAAPARADVSPRPIASTGPQTSARGGGAQPYVAIDANAVLRKRRAKPRCATHNTIAQNPDAETFVSVSSAKDDCRPLTARY